jgi:hypothetical protein
MDKSFITGIFGDSPSEGNLPQNPYQASVERAAASPRAADGPRPPLPISSGGRAASPDASPFVAEAEVLQMGAAQFHAPFTLPTFRRKTAARAALVGFADAERTLLAECFRQFGIETSAVVSDAAERLGREKFEACVVTLDKQADEVMEAARASRSNSRCVIYGVGGTAREALRYSKYGVNAMFQEPLERHAMLKLMRATRTLVLHEFRRYVRIPIETEVSLVGEGRRASATSIEMSSGGMSMQCPEHFSSGESLEVSFALMMLPRLNLRGAVSWGRGKMLGVKFDPADERRCRLKAWIDSYLEN